MAESLRCTLSPGRDSGAPGASALWELGRCPAEHSALYSVVLTCSTSSLNKCVIRAKRDASSFAPSFSKRASTWSGLSDTALYPY